MKSLRSWFWRFLIRRAALREGFIDPIALLSRLRRFAHPAEVNEPLELVRAGMIFHARGLLNTRAIQHNLDWIWPYWVNRQFDPADVAFIPRAFSLTHVNLTHRNWTATGLPGWAAYPLVDPRGLVTPFFDGWSIDAWLLGDNGLRLFPSCQADAEQSSVQNDDCLEIRTITSTRDASLRVTVYAEYDKGEPVCRIHTHARTVPPAWLAISVRPYNPEGVSLVDTVEQEADRHGWIINGHHALRFDEPMERHEVSNYHEGDVLFHCPSGPGLADSERSKADCPTGMATAAALFRVEGSQERTVTARIPLSTVEKVSAKSPSPPQATPATWSEALQPAARLKIPDAKFQALYQQALSTLVLMTPGDAFPGPYTYKRFWFRDAAFVLHALLCVGLNERVGRVLRRYPDRQRVTGYFHSQDGEWDSNGEALWIMDRYLAVSDISPPSNWIPSIERAAHWILRKRLSPKSNSPHAGLMPAGFSAEHLGSNDYYYWDNLWSVAGLQSAARILERSGMNTKAKPLAQEAAAYLHRIEHTLDLCRERLGRAAMPAAPGRRLDAGAVGSLAAGYPLQLWPSDDPRLLDSAAFLQEHCFVNGGFFQEMIHSGINAYLTLHIAQILLRAGDPGYIELVRSVADAASPTGQWPEAIHPRTGGGCMGDGQHVWAAAEWVILIRNLFVREEGESLILGSGVIPPWQQEGAQLQFGPSLTPFGQIEIWIKGGPQAVHVSWEAVWHRTPPMLLIALPGRDPIEQRSPPASGRVTLPRRNGV